MSDSDRRTAPESETNRRGALRRFVSARLDPARALGLRLTAGVVAFVLAVWAFSGLLEEVLDNEALVRWDRRVALWFHAHATPGGSRVFDVLTQLGYPVVLALGAMVAVLLWRRRERLLLWTWSAAIVGGLAIENSLKALVHRSRPQYSAAYLHGRSYSFPSGHAMMSTICYIALAWIITTIAGSTGARRMLAYGGAAVLILGIGLSRVYLGVHYPSDVLGGVAAGAAWLAVCLTTAHLVRSRPS